MLYNVLKFGAEWCGPCKKLKEDLERQPLNLDNVVLTEIDVDVDDYSTEQFKVTNLPTIVIIDRQGTEIARRVGYPGYEALVEWIKENTK